MAAPKMSQKRAAIIAENLANGSTQVEACVKAGISRKKAQKRGYIICKRPEVFDELVRMGQIVKDSEVGEAGKAVLVEKLAQHASITNREMAPFLQMSLQTGKKIGAGSVQQVPLSQTNIQINVNPMEQELMRRVLEQIQQSNPGKQIMIEGVSDAKIIESGQNDGGVQAGQTPLRLEAGAGGEVEATGAGDCAVQDETDAK